jgi:stage IV sporulation protein FB
MGLKLHIHPLFVLLGLLMAVLGHGYEFLSYFVTVVIHEMGHSIVAEKFGYVLNELKLMPYGAQISGTIDGIKSNNEIKIALSGPITNLIFAIIFTAVWWIIPSSYFFTQTFVFANVVNAVFNLMPVFPLDGGRIMLCLLSKKLSQKKAYKIIRLIGLIFGILLIILFAISIFFDFNISFCILGVFVFLCAIMGAKTDGYMRIYNRTFRAQNIKNGLEIREIAVSFDMSLGEIIRMFSSSYYYYVRVLDESLKNIVTLSETEIEDLLNKNDYMTSIKHALKHKNNKN